MKPADPSKAHRSSPQVLLIQCPDTRGIVAAVAGYLAANCCSIVESHHFHEAQANKFFMRTVFVRDSADGHPLSLLKTEFRSIAQRLQMEWSFHDLSERPKVLIAVSKFGHCLFDLLHRWRSRLLPIDVVGVVSNHDDMRSFVEWSGVPYHLLPSDKAASEQAILQLVDRHDVSLVVLARYMQILSPTLCEKLSGRCINIHHSFLPGFKGAKPYHQAYDRGVKLIGATAHYVTPDLDEGPIIEQDVERVSHTHSPAALVNIGRDIECSVLARAVAWHIEHRVVLNGHRTVVFG
jgi:formyltetrahydrofolate deformylase